MDKNARHENVPEEDSTAGTYESGKRTNTTRLATNELAKLINSWPKVKFCAVTSTCGGPPMSVSRLVARKMISPVAATRYSAEESGTARLENTACTPPWVTSATRTAAGGLMSAPAAR